MFSKTIFKQTLGQNWKLWAVFTAITAIMSAVIISVFDPRMIRQMMNIFSDIPGIGERIQEMMGTFSLLGMLGNSFYNLQGVILPMIFIIMTANSLIASQVDRGSMAYTLSTPITRVKVVTTQAFYMITSVFCMFLVITVVGLTAVQIRHNGIWGEAYTPDVKAASKTLELSADKIANDLSLILNNHDAVIAGAEARGIATDVYEVYLNLKIAEVSGIEALPQEANSEQTKLMQEKMMAGLSAAAEVLDMDEADLASQMGKIKDNYSALTAMTTASGLPENMIVGIINAQLANDEIGYDEGIDFSVKDYVKLNLGAFLLMFAIAGVSFMFSCIFNLTKNSLALGAGIPIACLIFEIMSQASSDLEFFKYLSLNTLFDTSAITGGGTFIPQFIVLAVLGSVLYLVGIKVFKEKDLPL